MKTDCAVLITAAGLSGRMGISKARLKWNEEMNFLEKLIHSYSSFGCSEIIVCMNENDYQHFHSLSSAGLCIVLNPHPELERMYSIQLGLKAVKTSSFCFIQAIDNPFIDVNILDGIYRQRAEDAYVSPGYQAKSGHPVLINKTIIDYICQIEVGTQHLNEVLKNFKRKNISLDHPEILININSDVDLLKYFNSK
ncbi:MAG: NTP transferase domain-containing protein [Bacteroidetes bacterium]|nr:NTP transferase domain-containing protein [Bacteroidota bacterium]